MGDACKKLNPHVFEDHPAPDCVAPPCDSPKRIRQDRKPLLNNLETEFLRWLVPNLPSETIIRAQAKRFRLGNGVWYKPDFTAVINGIECAWEVKGNRIPRGGNRDALAGRRRLDILKIAAATWPEIHWRLVEKGELGHWLILPVLP